MSMFIPGDSLPNKKDDWQTPKKLYENLDKWFNFTFDPCPVNPDFDGLSVEWGAVNFVNPPYGRGMYKWIEKAYNEYMKGKTVVLLIPARTDTKYWHDFIMEATEIWFVKGRLHFSDNDQAAPFPSVIVVFSPDASIYDNIYKSVDKEGKELL